MLPTSRVPPAKDGPKDGPRAEQRRAQPADLASNRPRLSPNRIATMYFVLAAVLLPWLVALAFTLPDRQISQNYRLAWVGFDIMLTAALARTAWLAWRRSPYLVNVASVAATLLLVDAWFDITTADSAQDRYMAIAAAVLVELPLSVFSMTLARRAQRMIAAGDSRRRPAANSTKGPIP